VHVTHFLPVRAQAEQPHGKLPSKPIKASSQSAVAPPFPRFLREGGPSAMPTGGCRAFELEKPPQSGHPRRDASWFPTRIQSRSFRVTRGQTRVTREGNAGTDGTSSFCYVRGKATVHATHFLPVRAQAEQPQGKLPSKPIKASSQSAVAPPFPRFLREGGPSAMPTGGCRAFELEKPPQSGHPILSVLCPQGGNHGREQGKYFPIARMSPSRMSQKERALLIA
jgi:hypothetical protein